MVVWCGFFFCICRESRKEEVRRRLSEMEAKEERLFFFQRQAEFEQRKEEKVGGRQDRTKLLIEESFFISLSLSPFL